MGYMTALSLATVTLAASSSPASAEPWIDYDIVLSEHANQVVSQVDEEGRLVEVLEMPNGVDVRCVNREKGGSCEGYDTSGAAVGCLMVKVLGLQMAIQACPDLSNQDEQKKIEGLLADLSIFVTENSVPVRSQYDTIDRFAELVGSVQERVEWCSRKAFRKEARYLISVFTAQESLDNIPEILLKPRLPVIDPCF